MDYVKENVLWDFVLMLFNLEFVINWEFFFALGVIERFGVRVWEDVLLNHLGQVLVKDKVSLLHFVDML